MNNKIPCCIVDDHCDVIPFLQALWRSKKIPFGDIFLLHVDSHADLGLPKVDSTNTYKERSFLEDLLVSDNGISEFILPLVCNGHVNHICWLHPKFVNEMNFKNPTSFEIGNTASGTVGVTLQHPYYYEDGVVYTSEELSDKISVLLSTCTIQDTTLPLLIPPPIPNNIITTTTATSNSTVNPTSTSTPTQCQCNKPWILDICLDYFSVYNPFLIALLQALEIQNSDSDDDGDNDDDNNSNSNSNSINNFYINSNTSIKNSLSNISDMLRSPDFLQTNNNDINNNNNINSSMATSNNNKDNNNNNSASTPVSKLRSNRSSITIECSSDSSSSSTSESMRRLQREKFLSILSILCTDTSDKVLLSCSSTSSCSFSSYYNNNVTDDVTDNITGTITVIEEEIGSEINKVRTKNDNDHDNDKSTNNSSNNNNYSNSSNYSSSNSNSDSSMSDMQMEFLSLFSGSLQRQHHAIRFLQLLPSLSISTKNIIASANLCLLLPHHPCPLHSCNNNCYESEKGQIVDNDDNVMCHIKNLMTYLRTVCHCQCHGHCHRNAPVAITIARSVGEVLEGEYTPRIQADEIQRLLLIELNTWLEEMNINIDIDIDIAKNVGVDGSNSGSSSSNGNSNSNMDGDGEESCGRKRKHSATATATDDIITTNTTSYNSCANCIDDNNNSHRHSSSSSTSNSNNNNNSSSSSSNDMLQVYDWSAVEDPWEAAENMFRR